MFAKRAFSMALAAAACSRSPAPLPARAAADGERRCVVHLHGKGDRGAAAALRRGLAHLWPSGNEPGWGGRQWIYFPEGRYLDDPVPDHGVVGCAPAPSANQPDARAAARAA